MASYPASAVISTSRTMPSSCPRIVAVLRQYPNGLSFGRAGSAARALCKRLPASAAPQASPVVANKSRRESAVVMVVVLFQSGCEFVYLDLIDRLETCPTLARVL